jgi:uncharacterized Fe-S cluster-containing radical SAM superfamily enzyme
MTYKVCDWDIKSFDHAIEIAQNATNETGFTYLPVDKGEWTSPRYSITKAPMIGDKVSKAINGDSYIEGEIVAVSKSFRMVTTSSGKKFYRRKFSASWVYAQHFYLVQGHEEKRNPHI